jgi:hypothetical protein
MEQCYSSRLAGGGQYGSNVQSSQSSLLEATRTGESEVIFPHRSSPPDNVERFIGRDDILAQISSFLKPNNSLEPRHCCLWDLGESGNRKPALAYANRYSADYDAVFWIRAATETSLNQGFRDIALDLGLVDHSRTRQMRIRNLFTAGSKSTPLFMRTRVQSIC